jgi:hypothetical protein
LAEAHCTSSGNDRFGANKKEKVTKEGDKNKNVTDGANQNMTKRGTL